MCNKVNYAQVCKNKTKNKQKTTKKTQQSPTKSHTRGAVKNLFYYFLIS